MEKEISRRDFLKISSIGVGTLMLGSFLDSPINYSIEKIGKLTYKSDKNGPLENNFGPLENNLTLGNSNFDFFKGIIGELDSTIHFKRGIKLEFKNNIFSIPYNFSYREIPELLIILKKRINSPAFENILIRIRENYENKAYLIYKASLKSKNKDFYIQNAIKVFSIGCLYSGINDEKEILSKFERLIDEQKSDKGSEKEIDKIVIKYESQLKLSNIKLPKISLNNDEKNVFIKSINSKEALFILYKKIDSYIFSLKIENKIGISSVLKNIISTKLKTFEIMNYNKEESLNLILGEINSYLIGISSKNKDFARNDFEKGINQNIINSLKHDFEKGVYYSMSKDINPVLKKNINQSVIESMINFENIGIDSKNYIEFNVLVDYITKNCKKDELIDFYKLYKKLKKPYPIDKFLLTLPLKHQKEIKKLVNSFDKTYESKEFKEIINDIKNSNFKVVKEKIKYLNDEQKANILYLIFSNVGNNIYHDLILKSVNTERFNSLHSTKIESKLLNNVIGNNSELAMSVLTGNNFLETKERINNYKIGNFQIDNLKKAKGQYNCMTISAIGNYIIEDLFGLKGKGIAVFKLQGEKTNHILNGIEAGDKLIWIDITNNEYSIINNKTFDKDNYYDIMDFSNAYFIGAIDGIGTDEGLKLFKSKKRQSYIKGYLDRDGDESSLLSKANRDNSKYRRGVKKKDI